jgi:hypothetical protein
MTSVFDPERTFDLNGLLTWPNTFLKWYTCLFLGDIERRNAPTRCSPPSGVRGLSGPPSWGRFFRTISLLVACRYLAGEPHQW